MQVVFAQEHFPTEVISTIFLAGPTPRDYTKVQSWRDAALAALEKAGFQGHVFVPEPRDKVWKKDPGAYDAQIEWEDEALNRADVILFWIPREIPLMLGLTTNDEWGAWKDSGKVVLGAPSDAASTSYQKYHAEKLGVQVFDKLEDTVKAAVERVKVGCPRNGVECQVPMHIWNTPYFRAWYNAQLHAGNRVERVRVSWSLQVGPKKETPVLWVVDAHVFITAENRIKDNEVIVGRSDIAATVLWQRATNLRDTQVVLVREFRTPSRSFDGYVRELPGGSSKNHGTFFQTAVEELHEETNIVVAAEPTLTIAKDRLMTHPPRQMAATLSCFSGACFSAEVTAEEMTKIRATIGKVHGVVEDGERTYIEVRTVGELLDFDVTDWSTLGMIFMALSKAMR